MSLSNRNAHNPLLEAITLWWPTQIEDMLQLASISSEDVLQLAMEGFDKMRTAEDLCSAAEAFPLDCLIKIARRFPNVDKAQQRRCAALVSEVLSLCMTLTDDWQMQDAVGDLSRKAGEYECMVDVWNSLSPYVRTVGFGQVQDWVKKQWEGEKIQVYEMVCLPPMLTVDRAKTLYLTLRENSIIEDSLTEEDFLQLFGNRRSDKVLAPVKWLANKDDLLILLRGIYEHWSEKDTISLTKLMQIAHTLFVSKNGNPYSSSMKMKASYKGENPVIANFLATL